MIQITDYIWLDAEGEFRSKTRTFNYQINTLNDIPNWNYDGSSTGQCHPDGNTEIILKPVYFIRDFLRNTKFTAFFVLCETYFTDGTPTPSNHRCKAKRLFELAKENMSKDLKPTFGLEQEYFMEYYLPATRGKHYCCPIKYNIYKEIQIAEEHYHLCLEGGIKISGINSEVAERQWEFQIGPCEGIEVADQLLLAKYLLKRVATKYGVEINFSPKPLKDANGSGCHINFSTVDTMQPGGLEHIHRYISNMEKNHQQDLTYYGEHNDLRLTGKNETSNYDNFTFGVGTRNTSVRIPNETFKNGFGYFEDRRPASNMDPYLGISTLFKNVVSPTESNVAV